MCTVNPRIPHPISKSTGRVGRRKGGLVITFLRSVRPRDLNHYEFFIGYHRSLHRFVEPVSVYPFSPKALSRIIGPATVALLRNAWQIDGVPVNDVWSYESKAGKKSKSNIQIKSGSREMHNLRSSNEVMNIINIIERRSQRQPEFRRPEAGTIAGYVKHEFDRWETFALRFQNELLYWEQTLTGTPIHPVVLGYPHYDENNAVFINSPTSLREVESTCGFGDDVF